MAYQAIYRRWRPTTFDDVVGQEHITKTLKNQIMNQSTAHAYLFCGTRGTGKTSTAKILARAVNCLNPKDGNPCNECSVCKGLLDESILDVTELDGASKNKVENIRDIIDDVMFLPAVAKKKVYIIDEVHMVTQQAFNALLKTLEEPPEHVMFILATTELNKVPITVLSRCQQFEFRRITNSDIAGRMQSILESDGLHAEPAALSLVAELGDGSMRDALSILDKCVGAAGDTLTYDDVVKIVGIADNEALYSLSESIAAGNAKDALEKISQVIEKGKELGLFAERFTKYLRDILVVKITGNAEEFLNTSAENIEKIELLTEKFSKERLLRAIDLLCNASSQAKYTGSSRTLYEMALVKMCEPDMENSQLALLDRITDLENKLKNGVLTTVSAKTSTHNAGMPKTETAENHGAPQPVDQSTPEKPVASVSEPKPVPPVEKPETESPQKHSLSEQDDATARWPEIINYIKSHGGLPIFSHLSMAKVKIVNGKLCLIFGDNALVSKGLVSKATNIKLIEDATLAVLGTKIPVSCVTPREIGDDSDDPLKKLEELSKIHSEIEFI